MRLSLAVFALLVLPLSWSAADTGAQQDELVTRLTKEQPVETTRPEKTAKALKECVDRDYVHVLFTKTGTELAVQLDRRDCRFNEADFENAKGSVHLVGALILNREKVRCIFDIDLSTCEGTGRLERLSDEEYDQMIGRVKN